MTREPSKMGAKATGKAKAAGKILKGETGILRHLADEHGEVDGLMKRIANADDDELREDLFPEVQTMLLAHAEAEEAEFYPVLRDIGLDVLVERSIDQHREVERLLEELDADDLSTQTWQSTFARLQQAVEQHVQLEEEEIFPQAKDLLDGDELRHMLEQYERAHKAAQSRFR